MSTPPSPATAAAPDAADAAGQKPEPSTAVPEQSPPRARGWCRNCDTELHGRYCSQCGQRDDEYSVSLAVLARDFADEYLSFDSRLLRTLLSLFLRPGFLTRQYLIGRRARYVGPLRLYVTASVLFFLAFSVFGGGLEVGVAGAGVEGESEPGMRPPVATDTRVLREIEREPWYEEIRGEFTIAGYRFDTQERARRLAALGPQGVIDAFTAGFERYLPRMMFLLLPLFAVLLKVLYARRRWYYAEHFIFALHIHAFFFALFLPLVMLPDHLRPTRLLLLWGMLYTLLAMRQVYRQGWVKTGVKYLVLTSAYSTALALSFVGLLVATVLLI